MENRRTWAVILGTTAGVAMVSLAVAWYMRSRDNAEPLVKDVQGMITDAYDKIRDMEQTLTKWRSADEPA
jgi:hypothetical protein